METDERVVDEGHGGEAPDDVLLAEELCELDGLHADDRRAGDAPLFLRPARDGHVDLHLEGLEERIVLDDVRGVLRPEDQAQRLGRVEGPLVGDRVSRVERDHRTLLQGFCEEAPLTYWNICPPGEGVGDAFCSTGLHSWILHRGDDTLGGNRPGRGLLRVLLGLGLLDGLVQGHVRVDLGEVVGS